MNKSTIKESFSKISKKINLQELLIKITQNRNNLILAIVVLVAILYLDFAFGLKSQMRAIGTVNPKIERLRIDIKQIKQALVDMQTQKPDTEAVKVQIKTLATDSQMSWLIEEISRLANEHNVRIFNIKPQRNASDITKRSASAKKYSSIVFQMEVSSGYFHLARFLTALENHSILFEIEDLNIRGNDKDPFSHMISLTLKIYTNP